MKAEKKVKWTGKELVGPKITVKDSKEKFLKTIFSEKQ